MVPSVLEIYIGLCKFLPQLPAARANSKDRTILRLPISSLFEDLGFDLKDHSRGPSLDLDISQSLSNTSRVGLGDRNKTCYRGFHYQFRWVKSNFTFSISTYENLGQRQLHFTISSNERYGSKVDKLKTCSFHCTCVQQWSWKNGGHVGKASCQDDDFWGFKLVLFPCKNRLRIQEWRRTSLSIPSLAHVWASTRIECDWSWISCSWWRTRISCIQNTGYIQYLTFKSAEAMDMHYIKEEFSLICCWKSGIVSKGTCCLI